MDSCVDCGKPSGDKVLCAGCNASLNGGPKAPKAPGRPKQTAKPKRPMGAYGKAPAKPKPGIKPMAKFQPGQGGLAAAIGRRKMGSAKFQKLAAAGRKA